MTPALIEPFLGKASGKTAGPCWVCGKETEQFAIIDEVFYWLHRRHDKRARSH